MHQTPTDGEDNEGVAHLRVELYPPDRTVEKPEYPAGSEVGAGAFLFDALPETMATELRETVEEARR